MPHTVPLELGGKADVVVHLDATTVSVQGVTVKESFDQRSNVRWWAFSVWTQFTV
jgi:hypothetical protein